MTVYLWHDLSPEDGCTLVYFMLEAESLHAVASAARAIPNAQNTTSLKLLQRGRARAAAECLRKCQARAMASQRPGDLPPPEQRGIALATRAKLALLPPVGLLVLVGLRAWSARYDLGSDAQLNELGEQLVLLGLAAASALLGSTSPRLGLPWRRVLLLVAVASTLGGLAWGLPAEARSRAVAHHCACDGG